MKALSIFFIAGLMATASATGLQAQQMQSSQYISEDAAVARMGLGGNSGSGSSVMLIRYEVRYSPVQKHTFITWQTISEINNHRFEIESSADGQSFNKIGSVPGHPNSNSIQYYKFVDTAPASGRTFYRLKQIGTDSSFTYSRILSTTTRRVSQPIVVTLSPNPCLNGNCDVRIANPNPGTGTTTVELLDENGRLVLSRNLSATSTGLSLSAADIPSRKGVYYLRIISGDEAAVQRVLFD